jgi:hypothetical protein
MQIAILETIRGLAMSTLVKQDKSNHQGLEIE